MKKDNKFGIGVIVPVYNEENAILTTLNDLSRELKDCGAYEIIVVNDGSTDSTSEKLNNIVLDNFLVINHVENLGYGKSLFDGIAKTKYDCITIIDGDGSYPPSSIKDLLKYYPQYDMVVGERRGKEYKKGFFKKPARKLFQYLAEYASGRKIPDVNSGLRIFKKDIMMKFQDSLCTGFSFTTTLTLLFMLNYYCIKYVSIDYLKREGKSKVDHFKDTLRAGQIIIEAILYYNPIKLFLLIATCNLIFGVMVGILNHFLLKIDSLSVFSAICVAIWIPTFCLGLIADQLKKIYNINKEDRK